MHTQVPNRPHSYLPWTLISILLTLMGAALGLSTIGNWILLRFILGQFFGGFGFILGLITLIRYQKSRRVRISKFSQEIHYSPDSPNRSSNNSEKIKIRVSKYGLGRSSIIIIGFLLTIVTIFVWIGFIPLPIIGQVMMGFGVISVILYLQKIVPRLRNGNSVHPQQTIQQSQATQNTRSFRMRGIISLVMIMLGFTFGIITMTLWITPLFILAQLLGTGGLVYGIITLIKDRRYRRESAMFPTYITIHRPRTDNVKVYSSIRSIICSFCGTPSPHRALYCPNCGGNFDNIYDKP